MDTVMLHKIHKYAIKRPSFSENHKKNSGKKQTITPIVSVIQQTDNHRRNCRKNQPISNMPF